MKLIAHRGLFNGPDKARENRPEQIDLAISKGFDAEVDVWFHVDTGFMTGHDFPQYHVTLDWLNQSELWIHAKNLDALYLLSQGKSDPLQQPIRNVFWHENDQHTLTSKGYIWTYPGVGTTPQNGILVMPEHVSDLISVDFNNLFLQSCYGICSDYVQKIRDLA